MILCECILASGVILMGCPDEISAVCHRAWQQWRSQTAASIEKHAKVQRAALLAFGSCIRRGWAGWRMRVASRRHKAAAAALAQVVWALNVLQRACLWGRDSSQKLLPDCLQCP